MFAFKLFGARRVPFVAASELNECGLACLASINEFFDGCFDLQAIRALRLPSGRGQTLLDIRNLAERMGLSARGVRVSLKSLKGLATPAILHWDMNHFVVLERTSSRGLTIMDPAGGRMDVPWPQAALSFTGVALELKPSATWRRASKAQRRASILDLFRPYDQWRTDVALVVGLSLLLEFLVVLAPLQMRLTVDSAVQSADLRLVYILGTGFALLVLLQVAISIVRGWTIAVFSARAGFELKDRFVRALHAKPPSFFLLHHSADILSRSRSAETIRSLVTAQLLQALLDTVFSLAIVVVMFLASPTLAFVVVGLLSTTFLVVLGLRQVALDVSRRSSRVSAAADALFLENARGARTIKLFGKEGVRIGVWRNKLVELINLTLADGRVALFASHAGLLANGLSNVALLSVGTFLVIRGNLSLGTLLMFFMLRMFLTERINNCLSYILELRRVKTHAERIEEIVRQDDSQVESNLHPPFSIGPHEGVEIELRDVWFRFGEDQPWVLRNVSLKIAAGESVAITGPSGSGKTTLMGVMLGLLEPVQGEVLINGRELRTISSHDYSRIAGAVMQDDCLFHGTVAENLSFFDAPIDFARVKLCAEHADIATDIEAMPMQYYSLLAEGAADISGGQKQRLLIARALYHQPRILFLDEATSHLDIAREQSVSRAVKSMDITRVMIAHRNETIRTANRVIVLDGASGAAYDPPSHNGVLSTVTDGEAESSTLQ